MMLTLVSVKCVLLLTGADLCRVKLKVYLVNHKGNVHGKQSILIFKLFIMRSVVLSQFRKSVGPCPVLYKYNGNVVITLYCIVKNDCLDIKTNIFCIS